MKGTTMHKPLWTVPADARGLGCTSARTTRYALAGGPTEKLARMMRDHSAPTREASKARNPHARKARAARISSAERFGNKIMTAADRLRYAVTSEDLSESQRDRMIAAIIAGR